MANKASDGAYFTRPPAADIASRLTLDILEEQSPKPIDWTSPAYWRSHKILDPAVGSGILPASILAEMKRRARIQGASEIRIAELQRIAVEEVLVGMDINPVSLQLAAAQLCIGNPHLNYRKMRLFEMPYGPQENGQVKAGTLEILTQKQIVQRNDLGLPDEPLKTKAAFDTNAEIEEAADAASNASIIITNPPYTSREKMGEKFHDHLKVKLRQRVDALEQNLIEHNPELEKFVEKNSIGPLFAALGEKCLNQQNGIFTLFEATIAMTGSSKIDKRKLLAKRFHIHTIFTVHNPNDVNLSQDVNINESILFLQRNRTTSSKPTRILNLDRFPDNEEKLKSLFESLDKCKEGELPKNWGQISHWPRERIQRGDWTAAIWRSPELADAAAEFAECHELKTLAELDLAPKRTDIGESTGFEKVPFETPISFPSVYSKAEDGQTTIQSQPDQMWIAKTIQARQESEKLLAKAGHLLITHGQDSIASRLVAVAGEEKYIGMSFMPVPGLTAEQAKALAVFLNSTPGRLQIMRNMGRKLGYPLYSPASIANIRVPDVVAGGEVCRELARVWEDTKHIKVPQYRDGDGFDGQNHPRLKIREAKTAEHQKRQADWENQAGESGESKVGGEFVFNPRPIWDECVASALKSNPLFRLKRLNRLRQLLHREPHIKGKPYNQFEDE